MKVDTKQFALQVQAVATKYGLDIGKTMRQQAGFWAVDLIKNTPHKMATRTMVYRAIENDLRRIFGVIDDPGAIDHLKFLFPDLFMQVNMAQYHRSKRTSTGRTQKSAVGAVTVGKITLSQKPYVSRAVFNKYLREVSKKIGRLRAGWLVGVRTFYTTGPGAPTWVTRHGPSRGYILDTMKKNGSGSITLVNTAARYGGQSRLADVIAFTGRRRQRHLDFALKKQTEKVFAWDKARSKNRSVTA